MEAYHQSLLRDLNNIKDETVIDTLVIKCNILPKCIGCGRVLLYIRDDTRYGNGCCMMHLRYPTMQEIKFIDDDAITFINCSAELTVTTLWEPICLYSSRNYPMSTEIIRYNNIGDVLKYFNV